MRTDLNLLYIDRFGDMLLARKIDQEYFKLSTGVRVSEDTMENRYTFITRIDDAGLAYRIYHGLRREYKKIHHRKVDYTRPENDPSFFIN